jgi:hypothetical protein
VTATDTEIIQATQQWLLRAVIGLNLCPFARSVESRGQVRYAITRAQSLGALLDDLETEALRLQAADPVVHDTTLLMVTHGQDEFLEFNFTVSEAERRLRSLELEGVLQLASFHPDYQFSGAEPDDITNFTNRAPWPTLHLLREASIDKAVAAIADPADIYERNMETLRKLGDAGWQRVMSGQGSEIIPGMENTP